MEGGKKAAQQMVHVRTMNLHRIAFRFLSPAGSLPELPDDSLDFLDRQLPGNFPEATGWDGGSGDRLHTRKDGRGIEAGMNELRRNLGPIGVNRLGQSSPALNEGILVKTQPIRMIDRGGGDRCIIRDDQTYPASGSGLIVAD